VSLGYGHLEEIVKAYSQWWASRQSTGRASILVAAELVVL
jgi:hypothetical protein